MKKINNQTVTKSKIMKELFSIQTHDFNDYLEHAPDGWDITKITPIQAETYHGVFQGNAMPLRFVFEGATILREEFYKYGQSSFANFKVYKFNKKTNIYFLTHCAQVDFATFKDKDDRVEASIADVCLVETNEKRGEK